MTHLAGEGGADTTGDGLSAPLSTPSPEEKQVAAHTPTTGGSLAPVRGYASSPPVLAAPLILRHANPWVLAETLAISWELFSVLLFASVIVPRAHSVPLPPLIFFVSLCAAAALSRFRSLREHWLFAAFRAVSWPLAVAPLWFSSGPRVLLAAFIFGLMAGVMRRALYRAALGQAPDSMGDIELGRTLRASLIETGSVAGIIGGHALLLFISAFLRTRSQTLFEAWFFIVPVLALPATLGFAITVLVLSHPVILALAAGATGDREILGRGLSRAVALPRLLAYLDFALWFMCTAFGVFHVRPGPVSWEAWDAVIELVFAALFSWGVAFYQRSFHRDAVAPAAERLTRWTGIETPYEPTPLGRRMLRDFGFPLLFTCSVSLLASVGLFRAMGAEIGIPDYGGAVIALVGAFSVLVVAVGGVVARAAQDLSRPLSELAKAADRVAHGRLDAAVPRVRGPVEMVGLGESVERMRQRLSGIIEELEAERAGLEAKVEARTRELTRALAELRRTQALLIQGERLASIGELVAGVAHEINNPLSAIAAAAEPLAEVTPGLRLLLDAYRAHECDLPAEERAAVQALRERVDLDASLEDLTDITTVIRRSVERSVKIVQNLRNFSRISGEALPTDLHAGLEETLMLLGPRLAQALVEVVRQYGELPLITCRAGEMNQVFMNLFVNALQAIESVREARPQGHRVTVETWLDGDLVAVGISDTGAGVPAAIRDRIFDPFFTTKPRGQGTGIGLSISTEIVRRHAGTLVLEPAPDPGFGARFVCRLPTRPQGLPRGTKP